MSFILDALKKSEAERQRQSGPTLLELRITQPRRRYPLWALIVGALLVVNVLVLLGFLLRRPTAPAAPATSTAAGPSAGSATPVSPSTLSTPSAFSAPSASVAGDQAAASSANNTSAAQVATLAAQAASLAAQAAAVAAQAHAPTAAALPAGTVAPLAGAAPAAAPGAPNPATAANSAPAANDRVAGAEPPGAADNPADDLPAVPAAATGGGATPQTQSASDYSNLPSLSELGGELPALQLNLLDYSDQPNERYALINMHRVREGDTTAEGARVLAITRQGVAMDYHGQRFLLRPAGTAP